MFGIFYFMTIGRLGYPTSGFPISACQNVDVSLSIVEVFITDIIFTVSESF